MSTWDRLASLPLAVEGYSLEGLERDVSSDFTRLSTVIRLRGGGQEGVGEDVTYDGEDHVALQAAGPALDLRADGTLADFCARVGELDLFPSEPKRDVSRLYRRWAFESAALDLALRQAGTPLSEALGLSARPVNFVVSMRLGDPATIEPVRARLEAYPTLRFKLDPTNDWDDALIAALVATGAVDSVDFKGLYRGTVVDVETDPELYRRVAEAFPEAWMEDPDLSVPAADEALRPHRDRITWDAIIHSIADIEALPFPPRMVNIKPSRFGSLEALTAALRLLRGARNPRLRGGQFELGPGRGHIQYLASLFHPDTPNDVAPGGYNAVRPPPGLPDSPLTPQPSPVGFRWAEGSART